jgi:hypothetical protein
VTGKAADSRKPAEAVPRHVHTTFPAAAEHAMRRIMNFLERLDSTVARYLAEVAGPRERLALLRWQIAERHDLDRRETMPGHVTTSAFVLSPDHG